MPALSIILILVLFHLKNIRSQWALRAYVIEKDFFTGIKAGEFSVFDESGRYIRYRLESRYAITQAADLYIYPQKQKLASIRNRWSPWIYDAEIQVYDPLYNQWIYGKIGQAFPGYYFRYFIQYNNRRLIMERRALSLTTEIRDEQQPNYILARIRIRLSSIALPNKYDVQVYTNELPDVLYFLATAAYDYSMSERARVNSNGK